MAHLRFNAVSHRLSSFSLKTLSCGGFLILAFCISSLRFSPHHPILTKHQAFAPWSPISFLPKYSSVRVEVCSTAWAKAWQETHDLRNTMKHTAHIIPQTCENLPVVLLLIYKFGLPTLPGQLTAWLKKWPHYIYIQLLPGTFWGNPSTWFFDDPEHVRSY